MSKTLLTSTTPKDKAEACREDTKRGAYIKQLFSKEGVSAKTSVLGTNSKGSGKLWPGVTEALGYGIRAEVVGAVKNEKTGNLEGGDITHFGILPVGLDSPVFTVKKEKKAKTEKGAAGSKPAAKAKPVPSIKTAPAVAA